MGNGQFRRGHADCLNFGLYGAEYTEYAVRILYFSNSLLVLPVLLCGSSREHHVRKHFRKRTGM